MTNILKTGVDNFFINNDGSISMQYDPYFNSCFMMRNGDGPKITISMDKISIQPGGQIAFKFDNQKYIIDDGYRNKLIMSGYLYLNGIEDNDTPEYKQALFNALAGVRFDNLEYTPSSIIVTNKTNGYNIQLIIESINKLIDRNIKRAELTLPMYPTMRGFGKNSSIYFRIYAQREDAKSTKTFEELKSIGNRMIKTLAASNLIDWSKVDEVLNTPNTKYKFKLFECRINKTIIKWEEEL